MQIPELRVRTGGGALIGALDLAAAAERYGDRAWAVVEDRLVRLVLATMADGSRMIVRIGLNLDEAELLLLFEYEGLRADFAQALYETFADFEPGPAILARIPVQAGWYPLLAGIDGEAMFLVDSPDEPTLGRLEVKGETLHWENLPFPLDALRQGARGPTWPYVLRANDKARSFGPARPEIEVPLRVVALLDG